MYKACIFDLDGTLTDTLESLTYSVNLTLQELGHETISSELCRSFIGNGARRLIERALQATGDTELERIEEGMEIYGRIFKKNCTYHVKPYEGVVELLKSLKERNIRIAVFSNKQHLQAVDVVETIFGKDMFDVIQGQVSGIPVKPDPRGANMVLDKLGVRPDEAVYIGDSDVDMQTGKAADMYTVGVSWGFRDKELLKQSGADATIDRAEELLGFLKKV